MYLKEIYNLLLMHMYNHFHKHGVMRFQTPRHANSSCWQHIPASSTVGRVTAPGYSMGNILEKIKKKFFLRLYMELYYKAIVWVIVWRKLDFFFCVSVWTYTIRP
jgi:hypothetical protein